MLYKSGGSNHPHMRVCVLWTTSALKFSLAYNLSSLLGKMMPATRYHSRASGGTYCIAGWAHAVMVTSVILGWQE